jgi:hypothetical protein
MVVGAFKNPQCVHTALQCMIFPDKGIGLLMYAESEMPTTYFVVCGASLVTTHSVSVVRLMYVSER